MVAVEEDDGVGDFETLLLQKLGSVVDAVASDDDVLDDQASLSCEENTTLNVWESINQSSCSLFPLGVSKRVKVVTKFQSLPPLSTNTFRN